MQLIVLPPHAVEPGGVTEDGGHRMEAPSTGPLAHVTWVGCEVQQSWVLSRHGNSGAAPY